MSAPAYAELDIRSNFSFLEGASHADELVLTAKALGLAAIGIADRNSLAGVVRAHVAAKAQGLPLLIGCRLVFTDETELIVYPRDRAAYGRLCRLLSLGKMGSEDEPRIAKGDCQLSFDQAAALGDGLIGLVPAPERLGPGFEAQLAAWARAWPDQLYLAASPLYRGDDRARLNRLAALAQRLKTPMLATNRVLYHDPGRRPLQDVMACIRLGTRLDKAGRLLEAHAERHLKPPSEIARLFAGHEDALARSLDIVQAARFSLDELQYEYPDEPVPVGKSADGHLADLTWAGAVNRYPEGVPKAVQANLVKELRLIAKAQYAPYFLTVYDIVVFARSQGILCQGRGSAANSAVCYCLGITAVDPAQIDLLFERFISEARAEPPDIDVDFEHERREEVIQYIYRRYGRHRAAIAATVISYRPRSAIRDVGKALGLSEDVTSALAGTVWGSYGGRGDDGVPDDRVRAIGLDPDAPRLHLALKLARELLGTPRHLSQHVGGFVLTRNDLVETVPVGNGAMLGRTFIEWDKDDIEALKIMKVDVLALGMLTAIRRGFDLIASAYGRDLDLASVPREDPAVYAMLQKADSVGVFQVESRAQMAMLPRLKPAKFYDLVIQVAIVRPGPIQGDMVHPYLNRRAGREGVSFPSPHPDHGLADELERVLGKTLGVPLFQEQAMRIAMEAARFTGDEANGLRKAMAAFRRSGTIVKYESMMVERMVARGYELDFAQRCFNQIKGFGEYGFPESHAASFAHLVYVSAWIKRWFPEVFAAALINSQPMGFYAPAQLVSDAKAHGVVVRPPDVNFSDFDCGLEPKDDAVSVSGRPRRCALRLGLRQIEGFRRDWASAIVQARDRPFTDLEDLRRRTGLGGPALDALAAADALGSLALTRRTGLWAARGLPRAEPAPLFAAMGLEEADGPAPLPLAALSQEVVQDYETLRLSLKAHPLSFLRPDLAKMGAMTAKVVGGLGDGRQASMAGVVLVRQKPGSAKGVCFMTLEDETGVVNAVIWSKIFQAHRPIIMGARLALIRGRVQRADGVVHLVVDTIEDRTRDLLSLSQSPPRREGPGPILAQASGRHHPRDVRVMPRSRDFR
jgi:error-prone DNA polymerase